MSEQISEEIISYPIEGVTFKFPTVGMEIRLI